MTKEQERARARKQREKYDARQVQRAPESTRNKQVVGVVVAVLAVIAVFIGVSTQLGGDEGDDTANPAASASPSPGQDDAATGSATSAAVDGCEAAPASSGEAQQLTLPDKATAEGKTFTATMKTNCGDIVLELDGSKAPQTVASFISLAEKGYYDNTPCPRVTDGGFFVLQCGDPTGDGTGNPGYSFGLENDPDDNQYPAGTLAMARGGNDANSNGSQFFIVYEDTEIGSDSAGGYSIFGKVVKGLDIVKKVAGAGNDGSNPAGGGKPNAPISILSVDVTEKA